MSEIVFNPPTSEVSLRTQIDSLQTTLASLNQQVINVQEALAERDQKIADLQNQLAKKQAQPKDNTLTIVEALINLYKFIFPPGKAA